MLFKWIYGLIVIPSTTATPITSFTRGHSHRYYVCIYHQSKLKHIFALSYKTMPQSLTEINNIDDVKQKLEHYLYPPSLA